MAEQTEGSPSISDGIKVIDTILPGEAEVIMGDPPSLAIPQETPSIPQPEKAVVEEPPSVDNLPKVDSVIAKEAAKQGMKIIDAERDGGQLFLVVEGNHVEDVTGAMARKLAYDARFDYGFEHAGVDPVGGAGPVENSKRYRQTWRLTRGLA